MKKIWRKITVSVLCLGMLAGMAGCQAKNETESSEASEVQSVQEELNTALPEESSAAEESQAEESESSEEMSVPTVTEPSDAVIGYLYPDSAEYYNNALTYVTQCAGELGYQVMAEDCSDDGSAQLSQAEEYLSKGMKGLILSPAANCPVKAIADKCREASVPVILVDRETDEAKAGEDYMMFIGADEEQSGYDMAMGLINAGCLYIAALGGDDSDPAAAMRKAGLDKALSEHPEVTFLSYESVSSDTETVSSAAVKLSEDNNALDGIWCFDDKRAVASAEALRESNKVPFIKIAGNGLLSDAINLMEGGAIWSSTGCDYFDAAYGAMVLCDTLLGNTYQGEAVVHPGNLTISQDTLFAFEEKYGSGSGVDWKSLSKSEGGAADYDFNLQS